MHRFRCAALACSILCTAPPGMAEEIYRTVDKEGRVIYSDRPADGARPVQIGPTNTMADVPPAAPRPGTKAAPVEVARPYTQILITEPADGSTVPAPVGTFTVHFRIEPQRRPEDAVQLLLDGQPAGTNTADGVLVSAERGEHRLQIQVVDREGRLLGQSAGVRVLVVRPAGKTHPG